MKIWPYSNMKQILLIFALVPLVGCGESREAAQAEALALQEAAAIEEANRFVEISDPIIRGTLFVKPVDNTRYLRVEVEKVAGLSFRGRNLSDESLKDLAKFKGFIFLDLKGTQVTKAGVAELQKALPKCNITSDHD